MYKFTVGDVIKQKNSPSQKTSKNDPCIIVLIVGINVQRSSYNVLILQTGIDYQQHIGALLNVSTALCDSEYKLHE